MRLPMGYLLTLGLSSSVLVTLGSFGGSAQDCANFWVNPQTATQECLDAEITPPGDPSSVAPSSLQALSPLEAEVTYRGKLPSTIQGDMELIEGVIGGVPLGLITYVRNGNGEICRRTREIKQDLFVRPLSPYTGLPVANISELKISSDECNLSLRSDGEFGLGPTSEPLLVYTSEWGLQLVQFLGNTWQTVTISNQAIPGTQGWVIGANPLSKQFSELQILGFSPQLFSPAYYTTVWARLDMNDNREIVNLSPIWQFKDNPITKPQKSQLHPGNPSRLLRMNENGVISEFSETGQDLAVIYERKAAPGLFGGLRTWMMPAQECVLYGLQATALLGDCPAVAIPDQDPETGEGIVIVKARSRDGVWIELLSIPYPDLPRVNVTVVSHLSTPRSVMYVTGNDDATLFFLDGSATVIEAGNVSAFESELLYFSESDLLGVYYQNNRKERQVSMVRLTASLTD